MNDPGTVGFGMLWALGAFLNTVIVACPLIFLSGGPLAFWDLRFLTVLFILMLWVGCDLTVEDKDISFYRSGKLHLNKMKWFPYLSSFLVLLGIWIAVLDFAIQALSLPQFPVYWFGFGISLFGLLIRFLAIRTLGSFFSVELMVLNFQPLITSGLFQSIRHPSYCGLLLIAFGISLIFESLWGIVYCSVIIVPMIIYRINMEEDVLLIGYGDPYKIYLKRTKKLIPLLY